MVNLSYICVFILGMFIGCLINLCIDRIPKGESSKIPPSYFQRNILPLSILHYVPILCNYALKGSRENRKELFRYTIVELLITLLLVIIYHQYGFGPQTLTSILMACSLVTLSFIDLDYMIIPDSINIFIGSTGVFFILMGWSVSIKQGILGFFIGGGTYLLIGLLTEWILKKEGIGGGDIKLAAACGICLGANKILMAFIITGYIAGFVLIILLILKKIKKNQYIPFGPFLSAGVMITVLFYENFIDLFEWWLLGK